MLHEVNYSLLYICAIILPVIASYNPFADNILFSIDWPGPGQDGNAGWASLPDEQTLVVTTTQKEKYTCVLPDVSNGGLQGDERGYQGPSELDLLQPLFKQTSCSYRIESYWTYELCHGRYLRQYHEEKELNKKSEIQEYFLGYYKADKQATKDTVAAPEVEDMVQKKPKLQTKKLEGVEYPFYKVTMSDGTVCDLTGTQRKVALLYICQQYGKGEIYELKETSSCEYEVVILTSLLCGHPTYQEKRDPVHEIMCHSMDGSPKRPRSLDDLEVENTQGRYNRKEEEAPEPQGVKPSTAGVSQDKVAGATQGAAVSARSSTISPNTDKRMLQEFLAGDYCLIGGTGWWKHEFCFGKQLTQYHEDKDSKTVIVLGQWVHSDHMGWLQANPHKRPKPVGQRKSISHFYGAGDICELTGKRRVAEVKLKCKESPNQPHSMGIYLVEPNSCEYILVVESPILCQLIDEADENGLVSIPR